MNYGNYNITQRAKESLFWGDLECQQGKTLPYILERFLLLENWRAWDRGDELNYVHLLLAETATVLLSQEERIRKLESMISDNAKDQAPKEAIKAEVSA